jgi:hypothetical protein
VELAKLAAGLDAELLDERAPPRLVDLEGLGLAAGAVEAEHQLAPKLLPQRVLVHQRLQLAHEGGVAAPVQVLFDLLLETGEAQLLQTGDLGLGEAPIAEVGERGASPQREGLAQRALCLQPLEARQIQLVGLHAKHVAAGLRLQAILAELLAQLRDVDLKRLDGRFGRLLLPERVDQPVAGDDPVGLDQEQGQERSVLLPAQIERPAVREHLKRAEDAKVHRYLVANVPRRRQAEKALACWG